MTTCQMKPCFKAAIATSTFSATYVTLPEAEGMYLLVHGNNKAYIH